MQQKILIAHLVSNGDSLMVTTLARQIKHDYPGCKLTWAISYKCKQVIENNPFVDEIWEIQYTDQQSPWGDVWINLKKEIATRVESKEFNKVFYTQLLPDNLFNYDGTTRSSTFRAYPNKITVPVTPVIKLLPVETERVKHFADKHNFSNYHHVILMECAPNSGQSSMNHEKAMIIAKQLVNKLENVIVIISSHIKISSSYNNIIDASELSYRENAELSKYCTFFIGCSSGITWLLTSDWAKKLPNIQLLKKDALSFYFASVSYDFKYWKLDASHIIEVTEEDPEKIIKMSIEAINDFSSARKKYHEELKPKLESAKILIKQNFSIRKIGRYVNMSQNFISRNENKLHNFFSLLLFLLNLSLKKFTTKLVG